MDEDVSLFGTLLLSELWNVAKDRGKPSGGKSQKPFYLYIDESQNFITPTIAKSLDQARGFGLHLTLAHQFPNQLLHKRAHGKEVYDSVFVNAQAKVVCSMGGKENLKPLAQELYRGVINPDKIKHELWSSKVMEYKLQYTTAYSHSSSQGEGRGRQYGDALGEGEGGTNQAANRSGAGSKCTSTSKFHSSSSSENFSWSNMSQHGESSVPILMLVMGKESAGVQFEGLDEQLY